jgi:hypothetical protein
MAERMNKAYGRPLTEEIIVMWVAEWYKKKKTWPNALSGAIPDSDGDTWTGINQALYHGFRNLPGGSSLGNLVAERFGVRNYTNKPYLSIESINKWITEWHLREGSWPNRNSGVIPNSGGESWNAINHALINGSRGLHGGSSLAKFRNEHFDVPIQSGYKRRSMLTINEIIGWIAKWHDREGSYPNQKSGKIPESPTTCWVTINLYLVRGCCGLPGGSSLFKLIAQYFPDSPQAKKVASRRTKRFRPADPTPPSDLPRPQTNR